MNVAELGFPWAQPSGPGINVPIHKMAHLLSLLGVTVWISDGYQGTDALTILTLTGTSFLFGYNQLPKPNGAGSHFPYGFDVLPDRL